MKGFNGGTVKNCHPLRYAACIETRTFVSASTFLQGSFIDRDRIHTLVSFALPLPLTQRTFMERGEFSAFCGRKFSLICCSASLQCFPPRWIMELKGAAFIYCLAIRITYFCSWFFTAQSWKRNCGLSIVVQLGVSSHAFRWLLFQWE